MTAYARITTAPGRPGQLTDTSTLTYMGSTVPIPPRVPLPSGGTVGVAPSRIGYVLRHHFGVALTDDHRDRSIDCDGYSLVPVARLPAD